MRIQSMGLPKELNQFVDGFQRIYGHYDASRTHEQLWLQVVEESSNVAEGIREENYVNALSHLANTFCWISGFVAKCHSEKEDPHYFPEDFTSIIWLKFPEKCPFCKTNPCQCLIMRRQINSRTSAQKEEAYNEVIAEAKKRLGYRPLELDALIEMFDRIYTSNYYAMSIDEIAFHFAEEVGEVAEQVREIRAWQIKKKRLEKERQEIIEHLRRELADVFSWAAGLVNKINWELERHIRLLEEFGLASGLANKRLQFSSIVLRYYAKDNQMVCRTCRLPKCDISKHLTIYQIGS